MPVIALAARFTLVMVQDVVRVVEPPRFIRQRQQHVADYGNTLVMR